MLKRTFAFLALAFALFGTQCWATVCTVTDDVTSPIPCTNTFMPGTTTNTYDFSASGDGVLTVQFETVLTTFTLTVTVNHTIDPFDTSEFPAGTVAVTYSNGNKDQYDFTGDSTGPNGVPVRNQDYKGLITLTLAYLTGQTVHDPAFAHAPGDITTFTENILMGYSSSPFSDPTMVGKIPNICSIAAADEPFAESGDSLCSLTLLGGNAYTVGQEIEVDYRLTNGAVCSPPIRDKTALFSLWTIDINGNLIFPPLVDKEEGNKFHWDNKAGVNEFDLSTVGLAPGSYTITVISSKISPQDVSFTLNPAP
jgi:hypothetical protein